MGLNETISSPYFDIYFARLVGSQSEERKKERKKDILIVKVTCATEWVYSSDI